VRVPGWVWPLPEEALAWAFALRVVVLASPWSGQEPVRVWLEVREPLRHSIKECLRIGKECKEFSCLIQFEPPCAASLSCSSRLSGFFLAGLGGAFATTAFGFGLAGAFGFGGGLSKRIWPP